MMFKWPSKILDNLQNVPGYRTSRKIIVFESDDWGSVRMPSKIVLDKLIKNGINLDDPYNQNDSLETADDLELLFDTLSNFKDEHGNHPVITANSLITNPNFEKVEKDNFQKYHYEYVNETFKNTKGCENSFNLWLEGKEKKIFYPQFHGREHLNVPLWMDALQSNHTDTRTAFKYGVWGQLTNYEYAKRGHFLAAMDYTSRGQKIEILSIVDEGLKIFNTLLGYRAKTFIAPNYIWDNNIEDILNKHGVQIIQGQRKQIISQENRSNYKTKAHYIGQANVQNQIYLTRNAYFEPSSNLNIDWVASCINNISASFFWSKPAIISSHRVNYIGSISKKNRSQHLKLLNDLIKIILNKWPTVEFMTSSELGTLIQNRGICK
jgi:hypothetical protein